MRLAHLSDVHVLDLEGVRWHRFLNKRVTGLVNVVGRRRSAHPTALLEAAVAELAAAPDVDHVVVTGDLSNLALESEFARARAILAPLAGRLSVIPGNHDVYTRGAARTRRFESVFGDWMWPADDAQAYPWMKHLGPAGDGVALFGFCSAVPRMPLMATGHVSHDQLARFEALVAGGALAGRTGVALVHHNLHPRGFRKDAMHGLKNRDPFVATLARGGVKLLLHGHTHVAHRFTQEGVDIVGSGSSTWASDQAEHVARYNVYDLDAHGLARLEVRRWDPTAQRFLPVVIDAHA